MAARSGVAVDVEVGRGVELGVSVRVGGSVAVNVGVNVDVPWISGWVEVQACR